MAKITEPNDPVIAEKVYYEVARNPEFENKTFKIKTRL
jgi:hypothetical protein